MNHILLKDFSRGHYCIRSENLEQWMEMTNILVAHGFQWANGNSLFELPYGYRGGIVETHVEYGDFKVRYADTIGWYQRHDYCKYCLDVKTFAELYKTNLVPQYERLTL